MELSTIIPYLPTSSIVLRHELQVMRTVYCLATGVLSCYQLGRVSFGRSTLLWCRQEQVQQN